MRDPIRHRLHPMGLMQTHLLISTFHLTPRPFITAEGGADCLHEQRWDALCGKIPRPAISLSQLLDMVGIKHAAAASAALAAGNS